MKNKSFIVLSLALCLIIVLAGCEKKSKSTERTDVVLLVGNHGNSTIPSLNFQTFKDEMQAAISSGGTVSAVLDDGNPFTQTFNDGQSYTAELEQYKNDPNQQKMLVENIVDEILKSAGNMKAKSPEVDMLMSLRKSAEILKSQSKSSQKVILVDDTGLSTTGVLNFRNNLLSLNPEKIVEELKAKQDIPDLSGITVKWIQEAVVSPQQALSQKDNNRLIAIWRMIIEAGGGKLEVELSTQTGNVREKFKTLPNVSSVDVGADTPINYDPKAEISFVQPLVLNDKQLNFQADSAAYISGKSALLLLEPIAKYLKLHQNFKLLLVGTTAGDTGQVDENQARALSLARANAVKNSLVKLGTKPQNIATVGCGIRSPWHISGLGLTDIAAAKNRTVVMIDASSGVAKNITK